MLKRGLSVFLAAALMTLYFFSVPVFAAEPAFDISDYTIEDLQTMTTEEKKKLMEDFIETYNPYGLRDLMEEESPVDDRFGVQLLWMSDSDKIKIGQQIATHQLITLEALSAFIGTYGFYEVDGTIALAVALNLAAASGLPDYQEIGMAFAGHFYDPDTGKNYLGQSWPTAATKADTHYHIAYTHLKKNVNMDLKSNEFMTVLERLGKCLHYVQDACEPHHASNAIEVPGSSHSDFESRVETNINVYLKNIPTVPTALYVRVRTANVFGMTHDAAVQAKPYFESVADKTDKSRWDNVGRICIHNSVHYSAAVIYKLFYECQAPFV